MDHQFVVLFLAKLKLSPLSRFQPASKNKLEHRIHTKHMELRVFDLMNNLMK